MGAEKHRLNPVSDEFTTTESSLDMMPQLMMTAGNWLIAQTGMVIFIYHGAKINNCVSFIQSVV
jgi:hypothetical protein